MSTLWMLLPMIAAFLHPQEKPSSYSAQQDLTDKIRKIVVKNYQKSDSLGKEPEMQIGVPDSAARERLPSPSVDKIDLTPHITINKDLEYTRFRDVNLDIFAPRAMRIKVSNAADLEDANWMPPSDRISWLLDAGYGEKRVHLRIQYADSTLSPIISDGIILDMTPPVVKFTVSPDSGIAGETLFIFNATESHHPFDLSLRWDWENDGVFDTEWSASKEEVHQYPTGGGKKTVRLEVRDSGGWVISSVRNIVVMSHPRATFIQSQERGNPNRFTFDASASTDDEDGNALDFRWDFNADQLWDTPWSKKKNVTHVFKNTEGQVVRLEAKDSHGMISQCEMKVVNKYQRMVFVPAGIFPMGSDGFEIDEKPLHRVFLKDYWIDQYPVTNQQYAEFLNAARPADAQPLIDLRKIDSKIQCIDSVYTVIRGFEDHPVIWVSWFGAHTYAEFVGKSLPTEAEWEKAARGTDERLYPWGHEVSGDRANYWDNGDPFDNRTTPVGYFNGLRYENFQTQDSPSPYGAYDLVDNVREWCGDWYQYNYYATSPSTHPEGPKSGNRRVVRGGGYLFHSHNLRTTFRSAYEPKSAMSYIGFRCVLRD